MVTRTHIALAAALIFGAASSALAEPSGVPGDELNNFQRAHPARLIQGRNVALPPAPRNAHQDTFIDRAKGGEN